MGRSHLPRAWRGPRTAAGRRRVRGLHRRRVRPDHRGAHHRARDAPARRSSARSGTGAVGLSAIGLARLAGASQIVAIGAPEDRLALARRMGADEVIDIRSTGIDDRRAHILEVTDDEGPDVVIEAAGSPRAVEEGLSLVRDGGTYVIAGHYTDAGPSTDQCTPAHQPEASRRSWLLGQRARALPPSAPAAGAPWVAAALARDWRADLRVARAERGARRRRGDADPEGAGAPERRDRVE